LIESGFDTWPNYLDAKRKNIQDLSTYRRAVKAEAPNYDEYQLMSEAGFSNYNDYMTATTMGFPTKKLFEKAKRRSIPDYKTMLEMDNLDFDQFTDYKTALERGFTQSSDYYRSRKMGAPDYKAFEELIRRAYDSYSDFLAGNSLGYPDAQSYKNGLKLQAHNFQEYQILNVKNSKREKFVEKARKDLDDILSDVLIWENEYRIHTRDHERDDFEELTENIEKLEQLRQNVTELYHNLPDYGDTFQELLTIIEKITSKSISLETDIKTLLTELYDIHDPIKEMLRHLSQISIPGILSPNTLEEIAKMRNIGKERLLELFNQFYSDVLVSDGETIQVISWVSSISEREEYREKLRTLLLTLPRDSVIALSKLKDEISYPGTIVQFEQIIIQVHSREQEIGELDLTSGVFKTPQGDFFADKFTKIELKDNIKEILEAIILENSSIPANQVSYQLGSSPTPSFYVALNEVLEEFDRLEYSSVTGMIRSIITKSEFNCPICRQGFKVGQSIGTCSKCKTVFHKNELRQYVLSKNECPQCKTKLLYDQIETSVA
jgi:hypothetical protein